MPLREQLCRDMLPVLYIPNICEQHIQSHIAMIFKDELSCRFQYVLCNTGLTFTQTCIPSIAPTNPLNMASIFDLLELSHEFDVVLELLEFLDHLNCRDLKST